MEEEVRCQIGGRLKEFRMSLGLTQEAFAARLEAKRQSVSAWERGKEMPSCDTWYRLGAMGMSLDYTVLGIRTVPVSCYGLKVSAAARPASPPSDAASGTRERLPAS
jgi:DNA-binding XRE family transcriptional regulator